MINRGLPQAGPLVGAAAMARKLSRQQREQSAALAILQHLEGRLQLVPGDQFVLQMMCRRGIDLRPDVFVQEVRNLQERDQRVALTQ